MVEVQILPYEENLTVIIDHHVHVSKANGRDNFRNYLTQLDEAFNREYSKTLHQILLNEPLPTAEEINKHL